MTDMQQILVDMHKLNEMRELRTSKPEQRKLSDKISNTRKGKGAEVPLQQEQRISALALKYHFEAFRTFEPPSFFPFWAPSSLPKHEKC